MRKIVFFIILCTLLASCVEEVNLGISSANETLAILVVEGTLTDELKNQQMRVSRMDTLVDLQIDSIFNPFTPIRDINRDLVRHERNATVAVTTADGATFQFIEASPGIYESSAPFSAELGVPYSLSINTADGTGYRSTAITMEGVSEITDMYAKQTINDTGEEGIGIFVSSEATAGAVNNLRFSYDETYKIIAPFWTERDFKLTNYEPCALPVTTYDLDIVLREEEQQTCYGNAPSTAIIQVGQAANTNSSLRDYMVRFINRNDFKLSHRYSIAVSQMVTGTESFGFYEQLKNFSQQGNVFSQVQPGFLEGNLSVADRNAGTVIGFFDVVSVAKKRIFFNYTDFYPNQPLPPYVFNCNETTAPESHRSFCDPQIGQDNNPCPQSIIERVNLGLISYVGINSGQAEDPCLGPHNFVVRICGDCTLLGSNVVPDFWVE